MSQFSNEAPRPLADAGYPMVITWALLLATGAFALAALCALEIEKSQLRSRPDPPGAEPGELEQFSFDRSG